jgi:4-hydroxybenzoate polyprenyltransferase
MMQVTSTQRVLFVLGVAVVAIFSVALIYGLARVLPWYAWLVVVFNMLFMLAFTTILKVRTVRRERKEAEAIRAEGYGRPTEA